METTSVVYIFIKNGYPNWISPWMSLVKKTFIYKILIPKMISWSLDLKIIRSSHIISKGSNFFEKLTSR
jgi:hypothetical protein